MNINIYLNRAAWDRGRAAPSAPPVCPPPYKNFDTAPPSGVGCNVRRKYWSVFFLSFLLSFLLNASVLLKRPCTGRSAIGSRAMSDNREPEMNNVLYLTHHTPQMFFT